ncbi:hypothetical protein EYV94_10365 [Puteibacter caeruleilacunae]|nr:hypothetical protein EYV94_10365 [Puteibacter caeruleilacunae]
MKQKRLIILAILFSLTINTTYFWEGQLGFFAIVALGLLAIVFCILAIALIVQLVIGVRERFKQRIRIYNIVIISVVLALAIKKPNGVINFGRLSGKDLLIAQREGAANCMTTFKLKENNKFIERHICFGVMDISGKYKMINDTIYFTNVSSHRHAKNYYKFAVIKPSRFNSSKKDYDLVMYHNASDSIGTELWIIKNELNLVKE